MPGRDWLPWILLAAGAAVYANSLGTPFVFDDTVWIRSGRIGSLLPGSEQLASSSRPVLIYSLALNYAAGGLAPLGYHLTNLAIHLLAGLTLFALVETTLGRERLRGRFAGQERALAFAAALLFLVHPLATQAVTYTIQRGESLMALCYLLTLLAVARGAPRLAVVACAVGMATKEVMVSAPLVALLYDRTFLAGSFGAALRARGGLYIGLAASWILLAALLDTEALAGEQAWAGAGTDVSAWAYLRSQAGVLLHYLRLVVWPAPLVLDYAWPVAERASQYAPQVAAVGSLALATLWALGRHPSLGFLGAAWFAVLAPTSSVLPIQDLAFEHRMYLALAPLLVGIVLGGHLVFERQSLPPRARIAALLIAALPLAALTVARNHDYRSDLALWRSVVEAAPQNARAQSNLGAALTAAGNPDAALARLERAIALDASRYDTHTNLGVALLRLGRIDEAIASLESGLTLQPDYAPALANLGFAFDQLGDGLRAERYLLQALEFEPDNALAHNNLASVRLQQGDAAGAKQHFEAALVADPALHQALAGLAFVHAASLDPALRDPARAVTLAEQAAALTEQRDALVLQTLALAYEAAGRSAEAQAARAKAAALAGP